MSLIGVGKWAILAPQQKYAGYHQEWLPRRRAKRFAEAIANVSSLEHSKEGQLRALGLNLFAGTCSVGLMLATPIPASSQPSQSLGLVKFGAAAVEEVKHRRYRYVHRYYQPYYRPYQRPYYSYDSWP